MRHHNTTLGSEINIKYIYRQGSKLEIQPLYKNLLCTIS